MGLIFRSIFLLLSLPALTYAVFGAVLIPLTVGVIFYLAGKKGWRKYKKQ